MVKTKYLLALIFCITTFSSTSYAIGPRLIYVEPASSLSDRSESLLGRYLYMGIIFADDNPSGYAGASIKYGWGKTGKKLSLSYAVGTRAMAFEGGVSYIKQDADATLLINADRKGYVLEGIIRLNSFSIIGVFGKENSSYELGFGF